MIRNALVFAAAMAAVSLAVACGDDDSGSGTTTSSSGSGSTTSGIKDCNSSANGGKPPGTCTEAEVKTYGDCVLDKCEATYQECFGAGYKSGNFSGPCGDYIRCANACECNDNTCRTNCVTNMAPACKDTCAPKLTNCATQCTVPSCFTSGAQTGGGKTCAELSACCATLAAGTPKDQCTQVAGYNVDAACGAIYGQVGCK